MRTRVIRWPDRVPGRDRQCSKRDGRASGI